MPKAFTAHHSLGTATNPAGQRNISVTSIAEDAILAEHNRKFSAAAGASKTAPNNLYTRSVSQYPDGESEPGSVAATPKQSVDLSRRISTRSIASFWRDYAQRRKHGHAESVDGGPPPTDAESGGGIPRNASRGSIFGRMNSMHSSEDIVRKVREGSESAQVFAGAISELERIKFALVRLEEAVCMTELLDAPIPIRFLFFILGPHLPDVDYHEIGRSISTLMSNVEFHENAYTARTKSDLLRAVDEILDESLVIPPGEIDKRNLLSAHDIQKGLKKRRRKKMQNQLQVAAQEAVSEKKETNGVSQVAFKPSGKHSPPPLREPYNPLQRRGIPFYGLVQDFKRRLPFYFSDFRDACSLQVGTSILFLFFAMFASGIAFGGLLGDKTHDWFGVSEVLMAQCLCGILWGLFAGQPLLMVAATGPVLVFEESLFKFSEEQHLEFLVLRVWVGAWLCLICLVCVMLECPFLIRYVTRFTEDIFSVLISMIFIYESLKFLIKNFVIYHPVLNLELYCQKYVSSNPELIVRADDMEEGNFTLASSNETAAERKYFDSHSSAIAGHHYKPKNQPDTALLTACTMLATFTLCYWFKKLRTSYFFGGKVRRMIGDFGVPISILIVGMVDAFAFKYPYVQRIHMPNTFNHTSPNSTWIVHPMGMTRPFPIWAIFAAIIPAFLVFLLIFVETEICQLLLASPSRGLRKGSAYHWDLVLTGVLAFLCSILGLPWMCSAALQSLVHVSSLSVTGRHAPGERPPVESVIEQRVSTIGVAVLLGVTCFLGNVLKKIPLAVVLGVFLYLGVMSLGGVQFLHRCVLFLMPEKYYPDLPYCQKVHMHRMHAFTGIQLVWLIILWVLKSFPMSALVFPFVLMIMCFFRMLLMPKIFTPDEINALDGHDHEEDEGALSDQEADFYDEAVIGF